MALIANIIKKYENQAEMMARQRHPQQFAENREDIFLKVEPRGDPVGADPNAGLGHGSIWKAQPIKLNKPSRIIENVPEQPQKSPLEEELERLRKENQELREKLAEIQMKNM